MTKLFDVVIPENGARVEVSRGEKTIGCKSALAQWERPTVKLALESIDKGWAGFRFENVSEEGKAELAALGVAEAKPAKAAKTA